MGQCCLHSIGPLPASHFDAAAEPMSKLRLLPILHDCMDAVDNECQFKTNML